MKFLLEIFAFFLMFLIFQKAMQSAFPVSAANVELNDAGQREFKKFRRKYVLIFWLIALCIAIFLTFLIFKLFSYFHSDDIFTTLIISHSSLFLPALILGLMISSFLTGYLNKYLQSPVYYEFFKSHHTQNEGMDKSKMKPLFIILVLAVTCIIINFQFHSYLKTDGETLVRAKFLEGEKSYHHSEIREIEKDDAFNFVIKVEGEEKIYSENYSGNKIEFINRLKQNSPKPK